MAAVAATLSPVADTLPQEMLRRLRRGWAHSPHALSLIDEHLTAGKVRAIMDRKMAETIAAHGYRSAHEVFESNRDEFLNEVADAMEDAAHLPRSA